MADKKTQRITLNASGVINPLLKVLKECASILFGLHATETINEK
jgi:hypothetical protein